MVTKRAPIAAKKDGKIRDDFVKSITVGEGEDATEVEVRLPSLSFMPPRLIRQVRRLGQTDAMFTIFELVLNKEQMDAVDSLDAEKFEGFCEEWRDHSGVSLGES